MNADRMLLILAAFYALILVWILCPDVRFRYYETKWDLYWFVHDIIEGPEYRWETPLERPEAPTDLHVEILPDPKPVFNEHYRRI